MTGTPLEAPADGRAQQVEAGRPKKRRSRLHKGWKRVRRAVGLVYARTLAPTTLRLLAKTWTFELLAPENQAAAKEHGGGVLLAMWHGRMLLGMHPFEGQDITILVSGSRDGDLSAAMLRGFGYGVIRGSSSRGGARALREMLDTLGRGTMVVITPDGPRGPRHSMNPGLAWMARATGFPVIPLGVVCDRAWRLPSWDEYNVPKPRARIAATWGVPLSVPRESSPEELDAATEEIRARLMAAERASFAHLGMEPDF